VTSATITEHRGNWRRPATATQFANALWAVAHGVPRLIVDGALALPLDEVRALLTVSKF
jgi:hypothetical protein